MISMYVRPLGVAASGPSLPGRWRVGVLALAIACMPAVARADGVGSVVLGTAGGPLGVVVSVALVLASTFHIADKIAAWVQAARAPAPVIAGHPKLTEALDALELAGVHVVQDMLSAELLNTLESKLKTESLANIGSWLIINYGPKLMADLKAQASTLLGTELSLVFGGDAAVVQAATLRLGVAVSKVVATHKAIVTLPSGTRLVQPGV